LLLQVVGPLVLKHCARAGGAGGHEEHCQDVHSRRYHKARRAEIDAACVWVRCSAVPPRQDNADRAERVRVHWGRGARARTLPLSGQLDTAPHHVAHWPPVPGALVQVSA
jgi:hypothetical protein